MTNTRRALLALALALVASLGYYFWYSSQHLSVPVAARDIKAETIIAREWLAVRPFPRDVVDRNWEQDVGAIAGKVARGDIYAGEPFDRRRLADRSEFEGRHLGRGVVLHPGHVALAVRVDVVTAVGGLVRPDDRVDIIVVSSRNPEGPAAQALLSGVRVLEVCNTAGFPISEKGGAIGSVVLELTPDEATVLAPWTAQGNVQLALTAGEGQ